MSTSCPTSPSSESACALLEGKPGGIPRFIGHWLLRSALIMPGLALAGVRDRRLITASLASSTLISLFLVIYSVAEGCSSGPDRALAAV